MNLGLLGFDDSLAPLLRAAARAGDRIVLVADAPPGAVRLQGARDAAWEDLLDPDRSDAVLVAAGGWSDARAEAVRKLVQSGRTLLLAQPLELSMLFAWELDMIRKDSGARLVPILPDRLCPLAAELRAWLDRRDGKVESIALERRLADRSRDAVQRQFCRDTDLVRALVGPPARLGTLGAAEAEAAWATLAVGLTAPGHPPARWQASRPGGAALVITAVAGDDTARLEVSQADPDSGVATWTWSGDGDPVSLPFDGAAAILDHLRAMIDGGATAAARTIPAAGWDDAARGVELAETIPRSLAKGRAVDLHQEEFTEIGTFKGTMASLGCGIVLMALVVIVVATLVAGIARQTGWELGERIANVWPAVVLGAMGLFLALQFLPLLVGPSRGEPPHGRPGDGGKQGNP